MLRQKHGIREGSRLASMLIYLATGLCCIVTVYPMYYVLIRSVSAPEHALAGDMLLFPKGFDLNSYRVILSDTTLWRAYGNTLLYVVVTTLLMLLFCTLCAYPLCMPGLLGKKAVVTYLLVPMYFSGGLIPTFLVMNRLGLYNNIWAVILPGSLSIWNIILARTYFASIPDTIRESAAIDGASHFTILLRVYTPLAKPILAVISIYTRHRAAAPAALPAPGAAGKHRGSDKAAHERSGRGRAPFTFQRAAQICDDHFHHIARTVCLPLLPKAFCKGHHGRLIEGLTLFKADFAPTPRVEV